MPSATVKGRKETWMAEAIGLKECNLPRFTRPVCAGSQPLSSGCFPTGRFPSKDFPRKCHKRARSGISTNRAL